MLKYQDLCAREFLEHKHKTAQGIADAALQEYRDALSNVATASTPAGAQNVLAILKRYEAKQKNAKRLQEVRNIPATMFPLMQALERLKQKGSNVRDYHDIEDVMDAYDDLMNIET